MSPKAFVLLFSMVCVLSYALSGVVSTNGTGLPMKAQIVSSSTGPTTETGHSGSINSSSQAGTSQTTTTNSDGSTTTQSSLSVPSIPTHLSVLQDGSTAIITWRDRSDNEDYFRLIRKEVKTGVIKESRPTKNATKVTDTSLSSNVEYTYTLQACNQVGCSLSTSPFSFLLVPDTTPSADGTTEETTEAGNTSLNEDYTPEKPSNLVISVTGTSINLTWRDNSSNEDYFEIRRVTEGVSGAKEWRETSNVIKTTDASVEPGKIYTYSVKACNQVGCSSSVSEKGEILVNDTNQTTVISPTTTSTSVSDPEKTTTDQETAPTATVTVVAGGSVVLPGKSFMGNALIRVASTKLDRAEVSFYTNGKLYERRDMRALSADHKTWLFEWSTEKLPAGTYEIVILATTPNYSRLAVAKTSVVLTTPSTDGQIDPVKEPTPVATSDAQNEPAILAPQETDQSTTDDRDDKAGDDSNDTLTKEQSETNSSTRESSNDPDTTDEVPYVELQTKVAETLDQEYGELASCTGDSCLQVCSDDTRRSECTQFAQTVPEKVPVPEAQSPLVRSVADLVDDTTLTRLADAGAFDFASSAKEAREACSDDAKQTHCQTILIENGALDLVTAAKAREAVEAKHRELKSQFAARRGVRAVLDTDGDGITDYDEVTLYATDPSSPDSDNDGSPDGEELVLGRNPLVSTTTTGRSDRIVLEDARRAGRTLPEIITAADVMVVPQEDAVSSTPEAVVLSGQALPNSLVTVYLFSTPIMVTVKADKEGAWRVEMTEELPDGSHTVYAAVTDTNGSILAKSNPLPFVKVAQAITIGSPELEPLAQVPTSPVSQYPIKTTLWLIAGMTGLLILGVIFLGYRQTHRAKSQGTTDSEPVTLDTPEAKTTPEPEQSSDQPRPPTASP